MHGHSCLKHPGPPATEAEKARIKRLFLEVGCICCRLRFANYNSLIEIHHIVRGNKRLGHWYTLPLCHAHHQTKSHGVWTSIANGRKAFAAVHGDELDVWLKVQHMLKLDDELPRTKVLPRRGYATSEMASDAVEVRESLGSLSPQSVGVEASQSTAEESGQAATGVAP